MKKLGILLLFLLAAFMAQAATVTLTGIDGINTSSFNTAGLWDNAAAPSAGNDYFVPDGTRLRTPPDGASYTFAGDSLTINNTTPYGDGFMYKGTGSTGIITIGNLVFDGGLLSHANGTGDVLNLDGAITIASGGARIWAKQGPFNFYSAISGSGTITNILGDNGAAAPRQLTLYSADSTFTGDIVNDGRFILAAGTGGDPNAVLNFVIGANGVNNSISGTGPSTALNGNFKFDLSGAGTTPGDSWAIVTASNVSYGETFAPIGFTDMGDDTWQKNANGTAYVFDEGTGTLSVYIPELVEDPLYGVLFDTEYPLINGDMTLPGAIVNPGWDGESGADIPGWTAIAAGTTDGGIGGGGTGDSADGDGWHAAVQSIDPNVYNIAGVNMIEGETYTFTAQFKPRWYCDQMIMSVIANDDPNILLASTVITFPVNHLEDADPWIASSVSYTATASDAGKKIGIHLNAEDTGGWVRFDDVHLYDGYLEVHGVIDQAPGGADVEPATPMVLTWTPTNDPNFDGSILEAADDQVLYYYIGNGDGSSPDYASYVASSGISKGISATSHSIAGGIMADQYCLWRVDTVINGITYTGKTTLFSTRTADEVPDIVDWDWWRTWVGQPVSIWAVVDDFGEGDLVVPDSFAWSVVNNDPNISVTDITADPLYAEATITTTGAAPGTYEVQLVVTDVDGSLGPQPSDPATFVINVYADACEAAIANGAQYNYFDVTGPEGVQDCVVTILDFADFAEQWLNDIKLEEAAAY